ncbi:uncharacterized protein LOC135464912 [Liolophura sinensis]|uniref:uncharacterized protein LOC135464912 n=1 Tax=Liolophura sinensis TaxID=3198878 RepID=UPI003159134F
MKFTPCVLVFLAWLCVDCLSASLDRDRRRFKSSVADRIGHGFGKRQDVNLRRFYPSDNSRNVLTTHRLANLLSENNLLAYAIVEKFIDSNGDGVISTDELLYDQEDDS